MRAVCQAYGLSEASPNVCMSGTTDDLTKSASPAARTLSGWSDASLIPAGAELPPAQPAKSGARLERHEGYYKDAGETAQAIDADGWLHTGDLGVLDAEGRLRFVGRVEGRVPCRRRERGAGRGRGRAARPSGDQTGVRWSACPIRVLSRCPRPTSCSRKAQSATPEEIIAWSRDAHGELPRAALRANRRELRRIGMTASAKVQKNKVPRTGTA